MLKELKKEVCRANLMLPKHGLVKFTWGNVSGIDRSRGYMVIKPSGMEYDTLEPDDMVVVDMDGYVVEGDLRPSRDTQTHLALYRAFPGIGGVVHTHSRWATSFAQAGLPIPALGITQADEFFGDIPCTRRLTDAEIRGDYEKETGKVIVETFADLDPEAVPGVLVCSHGPFAWGADPEAAVRSALVMEEAAFMDYHALMLNPECPRISQALLDLHDRRKHARDAALEQR